MNEHLTNLYRSCRTKEALASQDQYKSANVLIGTEIEKFAQLIVGECARVANDSNQSKNRAVGVSVGDVVREHFGVEE